MRVARFAEIDEAPKPAERMVADYPKLAGLFVVWDTPAIEVARHLATIGLPRPMATVDLGEAVVIEHAKGGSIVCVAAQQPSQHGIAAAQTAILSLLGRHVPAWVALPGLAVTRDNVIESFQTVWRQPTPREVLLSLNLSR